MTIVPTYGRDYKSIDAVKADFNAGKDFRIEDMSSPYNGKSVNKTDLLKANVDKVTIRYAKLRKVLVLAVTP